MRPTRGVSAGGSTRRLIRQTLLTTPTRPSNAHRRRSTTTLPQPRQNAHWRPGTPPGRTRPGRPESTFPGGTRPGTPPGRTRPGRPESTFPGGTRPGRTRCALLRRTRGPATGPGPTPGPSRTTPPGFGPGIGCCVSSAHDVAGRADRADHRCDRLRGHPTATADETRSGCDPVRHLLRAEVRRSAPAASDGVPALAAVRVHDDRLARDVRGEPDGGEDTVRVRAVDADGDDP